MRVHECAYRTCNELIPTDKRYCDRHKQYEQEQVKDRNKRYNKMYRDKQRNAFYQSKQWQRVRNYVINRDCYTCQVCGSAVTDRKIVDHIIPLRVDKTRALDTSNLWSLCDRCHNRKTIKEEQILHSANGLNKLKHISKERWKIYIQEFSNDQ